MDSNKTLQSAIEQLDLSESTDKHTIMSELIELAHEHEYTEVEVNTDKPWGAYVRFNGGDAEKFLADFFPELSLVEAQLGVPGAELSPKFLLVLPGQRLSWQYHARRAERWVFLTTGGYYRSTSNDTGSLVYAAVGSEVQFQAGERHRLVASPASYTLVAEIWQHTTPGAPSDESDIVRLEDDYSR